MPHKKTGFQAVLAVPSVVKNHTVIELEAQLLFWDPVKLKNRPLAGKTVYFYQGNLLLKSATTDEGGWAKANVPVNANNLKRPRSVIFTAAFRAEWEFQGASRNGTFTVVP
ncbi:MAG: hypothetical protein U1G07_06395 [Verrucomicrobiota bacterium]